MDNITQELCRCCKEYKPIFEFSKNKNTKTGHYIYCRECISKKYFLKLNKEQPERIRYKEGRRPVKARTIRTKIVDLLGAKCCRCGFSDVRALQIDHVLGNGCKERKTMSQSKLYGKIYNLIATKKDFGRYQILCANCNWIKKHENKEI